MGLIQVCIYTSMCKCDFIKTYDKIKTPNRKNIELYKWNYDKNQKKHTIWNMGQKVKSEKNVQYLSLIAHVLS